MNKAENEKTQSTFCLVTDVYSCLGMCVAYWVQYNLNFFHVKQRDSKTSRIMKYLQAKLKTK
jgi:hypothetical protein